MTVLVTERFTAPVVEPSAANETAIDGRVDLSRPRGPGLLLAALVSAELLWLGLLCFAVYSIWPL